MDPIFGLPCINESRAMDNARSRNYIAEKNLMQKFESLDLAKKSASGKLLTSRCTVGDFLESLDLNNGKPPRRGHLRDKAMTRSMSLRELDQRITEAKERNSAQNSPLLTKKIPPTAKASNPNRTIIIKKENSVLNTFDFGSSHIVDLENRERCLPINRQKHAMRDAYERAVTEDLQHRKQTANPNQSPQSFITQKGYDKLSFESSGQSKSDRKKRKT